MQAKNLLALRRALSNERLDSYRLEGDDDGAMVSRYLWNIALGESLYPALQCLEIALRNSIYTTFSVAFKDPLWFDSSLMKPNQLDIVTQAKRELATQGKEVTPGRIVAELSFGYWTSLLNAPYEAVFWQKHLVSTFPHVSKTARTRSSISRRLHGIRKLRNRIFHHEPVWNWWDLAQKHADIIEAIGWISPELQELVKKIDRFPAVYAQGSDHYGP